MNSSGENEMGVLHDYKCNVHGYFENTEAKCLAPDCQEEVFIVFLQAPGMVSGSTKSADKTVKQLAIDFNMSDIKSTKTGENQGNYITRNQPQAPREPRAGDAAIWGGGANGMNMKSVLAGRFSKPVRDEQVGVNPKSVPNLTGPRAASYFKDPDNLQINK
jgi:hypothetical protein